MPLGNLTSQFFANVYLNELDRHVKHKLKVKHYVRYVDDFILVHHSPAQLHSWKVQINKFLKEQLKLTIHPEKSKIIPHKKGIDFLGFKIFPKHKILKKRNLRKFKKKYSLSYVQYKVSEIDYDKVYDFMEGWIAYAKNGNTYNLRKRILQDFEQKYTNTISTKEINRELKKNK